MIIDGSCQNESKVLSFLLLTLLFKDLGMETDIGGEECNQWIRGSGVNERNSLNGPKRGLDPSFGPIPD